MKKRISLLMALLLGWMLTACAAAPATPEAPGGAAISVTDMAGRQIALQRPAEKIVVLTAADCEIVYALGAGSAVVGRGEYCNYPAEVTAVQSVQSGSDTNIEQIIALQPDVVIMSEMAQTKEQIASLEAAGLTVVTTYAQDITGVYTAIELIGAITDKHDEGKTLTAQMQQAFEEMEAKAAGDGTKTIYFEVAPLQYGLYAAGSNTFMDEMAAILKVTNIFGDLEGWPEVSEEQVIERNPDYIVTTTMDFDTEIDPVTEVSTRKGWQSIAAVQNGKVHNADSDAITRPGPRLAEAAQELYDLIYGD